MSGRPCESSLSGYQNLLILFLWDFCVSSAYLNFLPTIFFPRAAQEVFVEEMASTGQGNEWTKVARLCDFNPKVNKNTKDVSRMRSMLLHLKQEPPVARPRN